MKKRADQLVPGDVICIPQMPTPGFSEVVFDQLIVLRRKVPTPGSTHPTYVCIEQSMGTTTEVRTFDRDQTLDVEGPSLRPSQMHAEEMFVVLKAALTAEGPAILDAIRDVVDKIEPPPAPTIDELAAVLFNLEPLLATIEPGDRRRVPALAIIDRLRRSGAVK